MIKAPKNEKQKKKEKEKDANFPRDYPKKKKIEPARPDKEEHLKTNRQIYSSISL